MFYGWGRRAWAKVTWSRRSATRRSRPGYVVLYRSIFDVVRDFLHDEAVDERRQGPGPLSQARSADHRRHGHEAVAETVRRVSVRDHHAPLRDPFDDDDQSNRPLEDWGKLIGDVPSATAILDRFLHHAEIIQITGKSYRLRHQAQRVNGGMPKEDENGSNAASASWAESTAERRFPIQMPPAPMCVESTAEALSDSNAAKAPTGRSAGSSSRKKAAG